MNHLDAAKQKLDALLEKQETLLGKIKENYDLEEEDCIEDGDVVLEWDDQRDIDYADDAVRCQQMLVYALELIETGDKKSAHNANKALETLVRDARKIRKDKEEDVKKAQEVISLMNEIIDVCDAHRK